MLLYIITLYYTAIHINTRYTVLLNTLSLLYIVPFNIIIMLLVLKELTFTVVLLQYTTTPF